jgi:hypothetical protein
MTGEAMPPNRAIEFSRSIPLYKKRKVSLAGQAGQSVIEYLVVSLILVLALLAQTDNGSLVISNLLSAIQTQYRGYSHAISMTEMPGCMDQDSLKDDIKKCLNQ